MNQIIPKNEQESPIKKVLSTRDERIVKTYDEQGDQPDLPAIARQEKLSVQSIRNILKANGIKPTSKAKTGRKTYQDRRATSPIHARISQFSRNIFADYELTTGMTPTLTIIADRIGINATAYAEIMAGHRDVKLSELIAIAKAADISLAELVTPKWTLE